MASNVTPVWVLVAVTFAFETTAPVGSVMVPVIEPVIVCPIASAVVKIVTSTKNNVLVGFMM